MNKKLKVNIYEGNKILPFPKKIAPDRVIEIISRALSSVGYETLEPMVVRFNETVNERIHQHFLKQVEFIDFGEGI